MSSINKYSPMFDANGNPLLVRITGKPIPGGIAVFTEALKAISQVKFNFLSETRSEPDQENSDRSQLP